RSAFPFITLCCSRQLLCIIPFTYSIFQPFTHNSGTLKVTQCPPAPASSSRYCGHQDRASVGIEGANLGIAVVDPVFVDGEASDGEASDFEGKICDLHSQPLRNQLL